MAKFSVNGSLQANRPFQVMETLPSMFGLQLSLRLPNKHTTLPTTVTQNMNEILLIVLIQLTYITESV